MILRAAFLLGASIPKQGQQNKINLLPVPSCLRFPESCFCTPRLGFDALESVRVKVVRVFAAATPLLLPLSSCAVEKTTGILANSSVLAARGAAIDSEGPPKDFSPARDQYFRQADFGPGDPGVSVIANEQGGDIFEFESRFFGEENSNTRWVVDGYCNSACSMVLGTGRVCATPRAQFGFHAGYFKWFSWDVILPPASYEMYRHYPQPIREWVNAHHAMDAIEPMTTLRQPELATYVPRCRTS